MAAQDTLETIQLIRNFFPDLHITKADLTSGNVDFIVRFYTTFITYINESIAFLTNEEVIGAELDDIPEYDKTVRLFCKVAEFARKLNLLALHLIDFYQPNPRRMYHFINIFTHFVVFVNNNMDHLTAIVNGIYKKLADHENLVLLQEQFLEDTAANAETLALLTDGQEALEMQLGKVQHKYEMMIEEKVMIEKRDAEKETENNILQKEVDDLEYELKLLEDQENNQKECITTEKEFESLKSTEKFLKTKLDQCSNFEVEDSVIPGAEDEKHLEDHVKNLSCLTFDSLNVQVQASEVLKKQYEVLTQLRNKLSDELLSLNNVAAAKGLKVKEFERTSNDTVKICWEFKNKFAVEENNDQKSYEQHVAKCTANFEECQRLESEIIFRKEEVRKIQEEEHLLNSVAAKEYQRILTTERHTTEKFHNTLLTLKNHK